MDVSRITKWLQQSTAPLVAAGTLIGAVVAGAKYGDPYLLKMGVPQGWSLVIATLVPAVAAALLLWAGFRVVSTRSRLLRPERFDLRVRSFTDLVGRHEDIKDLHDLLQEYNLVFVDGESGSGKSSLVAHGLVPAIQQTPDLFPFLLSEYFGDWQDGLAHRAYLAIVSSLSPDDRKRLEIPDGVPVDADKCGLVSSLLKAIPERLGRTCVFIFDQFDDYQLAHRKKFLDGRRAWIAPDELKAQNLFWQALGAVLDTGHLKVLFVTRSDSCAGLHSVRFLNAVGSRPVARLDGKWLPPLLAQLEKDDGKGAVVGDREDGWSELLDHLQRDLALGGALLPQQVRTAFLGLTRLRFLTTSEYRRHGRVKGLEALYVHEAIESAANRSGATTSEVRALLLCLVEKSSTGALKTVRKPDSVLAQVLPNDGNRQKALEQLKRDEILRETDDGHVAPEFHWQLDHDYLAAAVIAEERANDRYTVILREGATAYDAASGPVQKFSSLLTLRTQMGLARARLSRRNQFRYGSFGNYAALSLARLAPWVLVLAVAGGWAFWTRTTTYQIEKMIQLGEQVRPTIGEDGVPAWAGALAFAGYAREAGEIAKQPRFASVESQVLASIGTRSAQRGETERAAAVLRASTTAYLEGPVGLRVYALRDVVDGLRELARAGRTDEALTTLRVVVSQGLPKVPRGRHQVALALQISRLFQELNRPGDAHAVLLPFTEPSFEPSWTTGVAKELHKLGDDTRAKQLLVRLAEQMVAARGEGQSDNANTAHDVDIFHELASPEHGKRQDSEPDLFFSHVLSLTDALREVGMIEEADAVLPLAIDSYLMAAPSSRGRTSIFFARGSDAVSLARILVRAGKAQEIPKIANREGSLEVRMETYLAAAKESHLSGFADDVRRFMSLAEQQARAEAEKGSRAAAFARIAEGYADVADERKSDAALDDALDEARGISEDYDSEKGMDLAELKLEQLVLIAKRMVDSRPQEAHRVALEAESLSHRTAEDPTSHLPDLARVLAQTGDLRLARMVAERAKDGDVQLVALSEALMGFTLYENPSLKRRLDSQD